MFKKLTLGALTLLLALTLVGCGGKKEEPKPADPKPAAQTETAKPEAKTEAEKPAFSADKAVLAYAQLFAYGVPEDPKAAGMTDEDLKPVQEKTIGALLQSFSAFPLSDENVQTATASYIDKLHAGMEIQAVLKKDDATKPVVEISLEPLDVEGATQVSQNSEDIQALSMALEQLHAEGITDDQLKQNPEFQEAVLEVIDNFTNEYPLKPRVSKEFTCKAVQGSDGKMYWAPENPEELAKFVSGM